MTERLSAKDTRDLTRAADLLRRARTVAFPTETVYGLGADALSAAAVEGIFVAKQRPHWDPLIVHIAERAALSAICTSNPVAERLMDAFWPGPLTLLLPRTAAIPDIVTAGRALVGVRIPAHPAALELLQRAGTPIAAPSANRFGHTSPTSAAHVLDDLDGRIAAVLDGGATTVGLESTVVGTQGGALTVFRAGAVTAEMLTAISGVEEVVMYRSEQGPAGTTALPESLPSPGVGMRHYAPRARLILVEGVDARAVQAGLLDEVMLRVADGLRTGVMLPTGWSAGPASTTDDWGLWSQPDALATRLFAGLRALDDAGVEVIVCPLPGRGGMGDALCDRLEKAARRQ